LYENASETSFTGILGNASHAHIMAIRDIYMQRYGKNLTEVIKKQFSGNYEDLLVVLGEAVFNSLSLTNLLSFPPNLFLIVGFVFD
jgi:hypothetical protein